MAQRRDWPQFRIDRDEEALHSDLSDGDDEGVDEGADDAGAGNRFGVPEHLIERSRLARELLGA